jgi:glycosyltransferase involved in cell wall biosynthesis
MNPAISVIIATRNYGQYLADAIASVLAQTFSDFELLIIDDGSTDDTAEVVRPFLRDSRVRYIPSNALGLSRAKNLSWQLARANLLAFLDADDSWLPAKLAKQLDLFRRNPQLGVVCTRRELMSPEGRPLPTRQQPLPRGNIFRSLLRQNLLCFSSVMIDRRVMEYVGGFDKGIDLAVDYDLWLRAANDFEFDFVDEVLVRYRTGHPNLSSRIKDRISTVFSLLRRNLYRWGKGRRLSRADYAEAWGSTCRTMSFARRDSLWKALAWNWRAWRFDGRIGESLRATFTTLARWLLRKLKLA